MAGGCAYLSESELVVNDRAFVLSIFIIVLKLAANVFAYLSPSLYNVTTHHLNMADCSVL